MKITAIIFFLATILFSSCRMSQEQNGSTLLSIDSTYYAQGLTIKHFPDYIAVEIKDPWSRDTAKLLQKYILVERSKPLPSALPKGTIVKIPIKNMIVYTSVQCSIIEKLGCIGDIVGVCEPQYIDSKSIKQKVAKGEIANVGEATSPNIEKMINIGGEIIIATPIENSGYGAAEKIGIPIIEFPDYMESNPLGRTEWIRFYGILLGKQKQADSIFLTTCENYNSLKELAATADNKPTLFTERKYGSSWFVPAGDSYMVSLYKDAGAEYIFDSFSGYGSIPTSFETVLERAIHADFWILKYHSSMSMTYDMLRSEYEPYDNFDAFKKRKIYGCNTGQTPYYDVIAMYPDQLLENIIWIFHPELLPDYSPKFFFPLDL